MEYSSIRNRISELEKGNLRANRTLLNNSIDETLRSLSPGDVIVAQHGRRTGPVVVIENMSTADGDPRIIAMNMTKEVRKMRRADFVKAIEIVGKINIPKNFHSRSASARNDLLSKLKKVQFSSSTYKSAPAINEELERQLAELRINMKSHSCNGCNDREEHSRWAERYFKLARDNSALVDQLDRRSNLISKDFERICDVLIELEYLTGQRPQLITTSLGKSLKGIHAESALLISETLRRRVLTGLDPAELAAVVSVFVYESRKDEVEQLRINNLKIVEAISQIGELFVELRSIETKHKLNSFSKPDFGFASLIYNWAKGQNLLQVLRRSEISAGDFVRTTRRIIDVLEQISHVAEKDVSEIAIDSVKVLRRGIVSASELED